MKSWKRGRVKKIKRVENQWKVELEDGTCLHTINVCLAIGVTEQPYWPDESLNIKENGGNLYHIFEKDLPHFNEHDMPLGVIGSGISAVQTALTYATEFPGEVTLVTRHPFRIHQFDSDPGWMGPKNMEDFSLIDDYKQRRTIIKAARHRGSIPIELRTAVNRAVSRKRLNIIQTDEPFTQCGKFNTTLLATGFQTKPPGMEWLVSLISDQNLPVSNCGYPLVGKSLQWANHLFVLGALAELEIGPVSRNIAGARRGSDRIIRSIKSIEKTTG